MAVTFYLESTPSLAATAGQAWISGWIFGRNGAPCGAIRVVHGRQTVLALYGLPRPDVRRAHPEEPQSGLSGFTVALTGLSCVPVILEWLDDAGAWHEFWRESDASAATRPKRNTSPALTDTLLPVVLGRIADGNGDKSWRAVWQRASGLVTDCSHHLMPLPSSPEYQAYLDEPAGDCLSGRYVSVSGWIFGRSAPVRRIFARTAPGGIVHLVYPRSRPDVVAAHAGLPVPVHCGFSGKIKLPGGDTPWFVFRLYAETADGNVHLVLVRRFFLKGEGRPVDPQSVVTLGALAMLGHCHLKSWSGWYREMRTSLRRISASPTPSAPARIPAAPAYPDAVVAPRPDDPLISILVPVFNPNPGHLVGMIASVQAQHYPRWELCLADDASTAPHVRPLLERFARADSRIRPVFRTENGQISRATNTALAQASGEFVALLDHDDLLAPDGLLRIVEAVRTHADAQFFYTDRDKVDDHGRHFDIERRGAWNPAMALTHNYLHQLTVIRRDLVNRVGGFRPEYFGSQDLDLYLRCHEVLRPAQVVHVPVIGYHWRAHAGSTASRGDQKSYMFDSARRGIVDALQRRGLRATPFLPDFAPLYGLNLHQLRWDSALLRENPVSLVLAVMSPQDDWPATVAAVARTVPVGSIHLIIVSAGPLVRTVHWPATRPPEFIAAPAGTPRAELFNLGAGVARHALLLLLDAVAIPSASGWLEDLAGWLTVPGVSAVGVKLVAANGVLASAGCTMNPYTTLPEGLWAGEAPDDLGHQFLLHVARDSLLLDPACLLTHTAVFHEIGGYASGTFPAAFFAADYCLRLHDRGRRVVFSPQAVFQLAVGPVENTAAAESEAPAFKLRYAGRTDPWIPSSLVPGGMDEGAAVDVQRHDWMPARTVEFSAGWFYLERPQPGETVSPTNMVLDGWCLARPGRMISELRVRVGTRTRLLTYGHPRPDLARAIGYTGEFLPVGFDLELNLPVGPARLEFEVQCDESGWEPVDQVEVTVTEAHSYAAIVRSATLSVAQFTDGVELLVKPFAAGAVSARAFTLARETQWQDMVRNPALPFHGFWDEPGAIVRPVYGGAEIRGWLFHETLAIRRVVAGFVGSEWLQVAHQHDSSLISGKFPEFPSAGRCAITGFVPVPSGTDPFRVFRIWAELDNGEWHLVYVRRCWVRAADDALHVPSKSASRIDLLEAALLLRGELFRCGVSGPGLYGVWQVVSQLQRKLGSDESIRAQIVLPALPAKPVPEEPHLLLVTHNLNQEGAPYFLLELAQFIRRRTHARLTLVSTSDGPLREVFEQNGVIVRVVDRKPLWHAGTPAEARRALANLAGELRAHEASLIVANTIESFWAVQVAWQAGRPSIFYIHEPGVFGLHYLGDLKPATRALAAHALSQAATRVSFPSLATQAYYEPFSGSGNQCIQVGWTDLSRVRPADRAHARALLRARLGLASDELLVINVGTVCPRKGQFFFVDAAARLSRSQPALTARCRFLLIGAHDNAYGDMVEAHVARQGLGHLITLLPATPRIGDYFAGADLFVLSSFEEGFPRVLLEAMGFALPIVSTAIHAVPEIARAGKEALLIPPGNSDAMEAAMRQLLENRELAQRLGRQAERRVEENFTAERVLPGHLATIKELIPGLAAASPKIPPLGFQARGQAASGEVMDRPA